MEPFHVRVKNLRAAGHSTFYAPVADFRTRSGFFADVEKHVTLSDDVFPAVFRLYLHLVVKD